jgi:pyruvate/2-oxoglutarate dehydrogenase complex dihydrolipoamide dehydrogenase (E3) component
LGKVRQRKRAIVDRWREGSERQLKNTAGLDLLMGEASFVGAKTVDIRLKDGGRRVLTADLIFINAGARPARPAIPGLDRVPALDSTSVMELGDVPEHLLVLGAGYVGLEFGQMFRRFGSRVTMVVRGKRLLPSEDPDVAEEVAKILREDEIEVLLEAEAQRVTSAPGGKIDVTVRASGARDPRTLTASHLLVAAGRVPNSDRLNLAAAGVEVDERGFIRVNERLETSAPGIYALGDVKGGPAFTHIAYDDFRIVETNLLKGGHATTRGRFVPYTVFIDPELGRVGMTEQEARSQSRSVLVAKMPMASVARAIEMDETRGLMKVVVDAHTREILGCAILGIAGGEVMSMVEIAMMGRLPYTALQDATFAHPTLAESLNNLFDHLS